MAFSLMRAKILSIIKEKKTITISELAKASGISTGTTIYRYLDELVDRKLITLERQLKKRGQPTIVRPTAKADALPLKMFETSDKLKSIFE